MATENAQPHDSLDMNEVYDGEETMRGSVDTPTVPLRPVLPVVVAEPQPETRPAPTVPIMAVPSELQKSVEHHELTDACQVADATLDAAVAKCQDSEDAFDRLWATYTTEVADYHGRIDEAKIRIQDKDAVIEKTERKLAKSRSKASVLKEHIGARKRTIADLSDRLQGEKAQRVAAQDQVEQYTKEVEGYKAALEERGAECEELREQRDAHELAAYDLVEYLIKRRPEYLARLLEHGPNIDDQGNVVGQRFKDPRVLYEAVTLLLEEDAEEREGLHASVEILKVTVQDLVSQRAILQTEVSGLKAQAAVDRACVVECTELLRAKCDEAFKYLSKEE